MTVAKQSSSLSQEGFVLCCQHFSRCRLLYLLKNICACSNNFEQIFTGEQADKHTQKDTFWSFDAVEKLEWQYGAVVLN